MEAAESTCAARAGRGSNPPPLFPVPFSPSPASLPSLFTALFPCCPTLKLYSKRKSGFSASAYSIKSLSNRLPLSLSSSLFFSLVPLPSFALCEWQSFIVYRLSLSALCGVCVDVLVHLGLSLALPALLDAMIDVCVCVCV